MLVLLMRQMVKLWESLNSLWAASTGGVNVVYHSAGWLEGGLIASYEKFVMDCEVLQQFQRYFDPVISDVGQDSLAVNAIKEVGPNGHFFGCDHTQERYTNAFYSPFLSDWRNYEAWEQDGAARTHQRANKISKHRLKEYEAPKIDIAVKDELKSFVDRRKSEGGVKTDF